MTSANPNAPSPKAIELRPIVGELPPEISALQADAAQEGYGFIDRLMNDWATGIARFNKPGEALLTAWHSGSIAGIGGVTEDPYLPDALRMRRFYVRPAYRRLGLAHRLAKVLLQTALKTGRPLTVNAGTAAAPAFWESLGCHPTDAEHHTHFWPDPGSE